MHTREEILSAFSRLLDVQDELREKCPWDKKQTNESLRPNTIEEVYELSEALLDDDVKDTCKELGDVLLHIAFYARIAQEQNRFDMADVCNALTDKLIFRHPHIYHPSQIGKSHPKPLPYKEDDAEEMTPTDGFASAKTSEQVLQNWEQIKLKEKGGNKRVLAGVPTALPSLVKAFRIQEKAANVGFDWEQPADVWSKVKEELAEFEAELLGGMSENAQQELGDVIFSIVNAARLYGLNPDTALEHTNQKFINRFSYIENASTKLGKSLGDMTLEEMDNLWSEAKNHEQKNSLQP